MGYYIGGHFLTSFIFWWTFTIGQNGHDTLETNSNIDPKGKMSS